MDIVFGNGSFDSVGNIINGHPYCLVTYDEDYFNTPGNKLIEKAGKPESIINNITPSPNFETLTVSCQQFAQTVSSDTVIIALGGSVIDAAKVLASSHNGFEPVRLLPETGKGEEQLGAYPIIAIPTTAGTGSEVTHWANDPSRIVKGKNGFTEATQKFLLVLENPLLLAKLQLLRLHQQQAMHQG